MTEIVDVYQFISVEMLTALLLIYQCQIFKVRKNLVKWTRSLFFFFFNQRYCFYLFLNIPPIPSMPAAADRSI